MLDHNKENQTIQNIKKDFRDKLLQEKKIYVTARSSILQRGKAEKIVTEIQKSLELEEFEEALAAIAILFQQGGTARSCDGNMKIVLFNKEIKLADIRKVLKRLSYNKAERKLARTFANEIHEIAVLMDLPGNLYLKIQKKNLERKFSIEQKAWLSDFQSENEKCPAELRNLILETFQKKRKK